MRHIPNLISKLAGLSVLLVFFACDTPALKRGNNSEDYEIISVVIKNVKGFLDYPEKNEILVPLPYGTDVKNLTPIIEYKGKSLSPESGERQDFSDRVKYALTSNDDVVRNYYVKVYVVNPAVIIRFELTGVEGRITTNENNTGSIEISISTSVDLTELTPKITVPEGMSISPSPDDPQDFSKTVFYTITTNDGECSRTYGIKVGAYEYQETSPSSPGGPSSGGTTTPSGPAPGTGIIAQTSAPDTKKFNALNTGMNRIYEVTAKKIGESTHCIVYAESGKVSTAAGTRIVAEYEAHIYTNIVETFGEVLDVDQNGKVTLLLLDILDGSNGTSYIGGYFYPTDMYSKKTHPSSNEADMLYVDINPQVVESNAFYSTIAHELQHLIDFSQTVGIGKSEKDLWINEGLSSAAEYLYGNGDPNQRVRYMIATHYPQLFFSNSSNYPDQKKNFFSWNNKLEDYSTAYLFFQWLRIHAAGDKQIYKSILNDSNSNYKAIENAVNATGGIPKSNNNNNDWTWKNLLQNWFASNYQFEKKFPGYDNFSVIKNEINTLKAQNSSISTLATPWRTKTTTSLSLKKGEGVIVIPNNTFNSSTGSPIIYAQLNSSGVFTSSTMNFSSGTPLIVFNESTSLTGTAALPVQSSISVLGARSALPVSGPQLPLLPLDIGMVDIVFDESGRKLTEAEE